MVAEMATTQTPAFPEALTWPEKARAISITDQASYTLAANQKLDLAVLRKKIVGEFEPMKKASHAAWKAIVAKENEHLEPIEEAEKILVASIKKWEHEQERIRREEEARLRAEALKREEDERLAAALEAEAEGAAPEEVTAVLSAPAIVAPIVAAPTFDRVKGLGIRETWSAQVFSIRELCRAVADGKVPEVYVSANMTALNSRARTDKKLMQIPGVRAVSN